MLLGETFVKQITNVRQVRVRDLNGIAKIEVEKDHILLLQGDALEQITKKLILIGFQSVQIDPDGYRPGKINVIAD